MKFIMQAIILAAFFVSASALACTPGAKQRGFVPKNNLKISKYKKTAGGLTEAQFNAVIDKYEALMAPIVKTKGGNLNVERNWDDGTVNAYAQQFGTTWNVAM